MDRARTGARVAVWGGFALALLLAPQVFTSSLAHSLLSQVGIAIIVCLSYNLLLGQGGLLSFGHAVYAGLGGFLAIHTLRAVGAGTLGLPVSLLPVVGGLAALAAALVLGWIATRKAATPFAMITLGVGELVWAAALMFPGWFGGEGGITADRVAGARPWGLSFGPQVQLYYLIAAYTFACTVLMYAFTGTPLGRMLNAVRDNPERAEFVGYDARVVRYLAFAIAAFFAGVSGGLAALHFEVVSAEVLSAHRSASYLLFTVLGGTGYFFGPILGAVLMVLSSVLLATLTRAWLLYLGLVFLVMVMVAPGGLAGLVVGAGRMVRRPQGPGLLVGALGLALLALAGLAGLAALVEMAYHLQVDDALGPVVRVLGVALDARAADPWIGAAGLALTGLGLFELGRRRLTAQWQAAARAREPQA